MLPKTQYARRDKVCIAYQLTGDGPVDIVWAPGTVKDPVADAGIVFADAGSHQLKGVPGEWRLFAAQP